MSQRRIESADRSDKRSRAASEPREAGASADRAQPVNGAQVWVIGTSLGALTNDKGYYFINNVPAGVYTLRATYIGLQPAETRNARILAGQTMTIDFSLSAAVQLGAITVTVEPTAIVAFAAEADARVVEARPTKNFGSSSSLRTDGGSDPDVESYVRFGVSGVSGAVQRAVLRVFAFNGTIDGPAVYGTGNGWTETGITWNTRPAQTSGAIADAQQIASNTWVEYDVTSFVSGNGTFSFALATTSTDSVDFYSRDSNQIALRPQLVVTYG